MILVILMALAGVLVGCGLYFAELLGWGWSTFCGVLVFVVGQGGIGFLLQKKVKVAMESIQTILMDGQKRLQYKMNQWQMRPPGSVKQAQMEMERDQKVFVEKALEASEQLHRFDRWVPMMTRQIATMQVQLYWMLKQFKKVDALLPKVLILDPMTASMKLARMYMTDAPRAEMEKLFTKQTRRLRYGQGELLYGLWSWILVQQNDIDAAHKVLIQACEKMDHPVIKSNRENLANNRINHFSNSGLGDMWYALHLEQPKVKMQRQQRYGNRPF